MEYPDSYRRLKYKDRLFVDCYLSETLIEPQFRKNTFSDKFVSFVFAYNKDVRDCMEIKYAIMNWATKTYEKHDEYITGATTEVTIKNFVKYKSLVANATKTYNRCVVAINDIRRLSYDSHDNTRILELKDNIYNSAIHSGDSKDRNENRKMAMKIFGLDQVKVDLTPDIYNAIGKNLFNKMKNDKIMQNEDAPIVPDVLEDLEVTDNGDE